MIEKINNYSIFYTSIGNGPPILLLHGNGEDHHIFNELINILKDHFTVYALDTRGHGQSQRVHIYHYEDMVEDVRGFILKHTLKQPILCGFSDGGIIGLMLASKYPNMLSKLITCGANTKPSGLKQPLRALMKFQHFFTRDKKLKLMITEPTITTDDLANIKIPVLVLAGQKDIVRKKDTLKIADSIKNSTLKILPKATHESYVFNNKQLYENIKHFIAQ